MDNALALGGLHTFVIRDKVNKTVNGFRNYVFKHSEVNKSLKKIATGISVYGLSKTNLSKLKIILPSLKEQEKIAKILSLADEEIATLEKELSYMEEQKKGLMQVLLTGVVRV